MNARSLVHLVKNASSRESGQANASVNQKPRINYFAAACLTSCYQVMVTQITWEFVPLLVAVNTKPEQFNIPKVNFG